MTVWKLSKTGGFVSELDAHKLVSPVIDHNGDMKVLVGVDSNEHQLFEISHLVSTSEKDLHQADPIVKAFKRNVILTGSDVEKKDGWHSNTER